MSLIYTRVYDHIYDGSPPSIDAQDGTSVCRFVLPQSAGAEPDNNLIYLAGVETDFVPPEGSFAGQRPGQIRCLVVERIRFIGSLGSNNHTAALPLIREFLNGIFNRLVADGHCDWFHNQKEVIMAVGGAEAARRQELEIEYVAQSSILT